MAEPEAKVSAQVVYVVGDGRRQGVAFFVDERHLLTCAHVVGMAVGKGETASAVECESKIVECEVITDGMRQTFMARVLIHLRQFAQGEAGLRQQRLSDLAVLKVEQDGDALPIAPRPMTLVRPQAEDRVVLVGVADEDEGNLAVSQGEVLTTVQDGQVYIGIDRRSGANTGARPGYSGGPVQLSRDDGAVVGIVQLAPQDGGDARCMPAHVIAEALAERFPIEVTEVQPRLNLDRRISWLESADFVSIMEAKDRDKQERRLVELVQQAYDAQQDIERIAVGIVRTSDGSCPEVFRNRLTVKPFAAARPWGARKVWNLNWAAPSLRLDGGPGDSFEAGLNEVLTEKLFLKRAGPSELRGQLLDRLALLPIHVRLEKRIDGYRLGKLVEELSKWTTVHASDRVRARLPFCMLLFLDVAPSSPSRPPLARLSSMLGLGQRRSLTPEAEPEDEIAQALKGNPRLVVQTLPSLGHLTVDPDLDEWILKTSKSISNKGFEPRLIRSRVLRMVYGGQQDASITFQAWQDLLDKNRKEIFAGG